MRKRLIILLLIIVPVCAIAQGHTSIMFWNLENYFDSFDDPLTADDEFTPQGENHWTWKKFEAKRNFIAKTILATSDKYKSYPALVGLAEVENRMVLNQLVKETALSKLDYQIIHKDSPDARGIDVALLYQPESFHPKSVRHIMVKMPKGSRPTRDILYVKGRFTEMKGDYHIFVLHWPSKGGGEKKTLPGRMAAAEALTDITDSLIMNVENPNIIIMGDFNDTPDSKPIQYLSKHALFTLARKFSDKGKGTIRYKGDWEMIDQFVVSRPLKDMKMSIFSPAFLLEDDRTNLGSKPYRTFYGPRYNGGVSDHLPIILLPLPL